MTDQSKPLLYFVTSQPMSVVAFLMPHLRALASVAKIQVLANTDDPDFLKGRGLDLPMVPVGIERAILPWQDLLALVALYKSFVVNKPDAVHTITPKAGLLGMVAAWLARVPVRVHSFTGQVWVTRRGPMRWLLKAADKCIAALATDVLVDSPSQRTFLIEQGVVTAQRSTVLAWQCECWCSVVPALQGYLCTQGAWCAGCVSSCSTRLCWDCRAGGCQVL